MVSGGEVVAGVLERRGVGTVFTLCGGHVSPILVESKRRGLRVIDVRDEASAVFAADAFARLTGIPGVAVVTAGPGVTNTVTAIKNAQLAQSPLVLLGGAAATMLKGRGALQDIDQIALLRSAVKWSTSVTRLRNLEEMVEQAFIKALEGVPGPTFVECPVDVLYPEVTVREWYGKGTKEGGGIRGTVREWYIERHLKRLFAGGDRAFTVDHAPALHVDEADVRRAGELLDSASRPVMLVGSQAMLRTAAVGELAEAIDALGVPTYLSGMARGLLGAQHPLLYRHKRRQAFRDADLVLLAGAPMDFRLDYGSQINRKASLISVNRSRAEAELNRRPTHVVGSDPSLFIERLSGRQTTADGRRTWGKWAGQLDGRERERDDEIRQMSERKGKYINSLYLLRCVDAHLPDDSVLILDGGDFAASASYTVAPRSPLSFLDPGVYGTLGVGGGFALGAKSVRESAETWIIYGDGSAAFSIAEFDTFVRHGLPVIGLVGNDGAWTQIARGQEEMLGDDVGTVLRRTDYHKVAQGYGAAGILVENPEEVEPAILKAQRLARSGKPVLINALVDAGEFRAGSISI